MSSRWGVRPAARRPRLAEPGGRRLVAWEDLDRVDVDVTSYRGFTTLSLTIAGGGQRMRRPEWALPARAEDLQQLIERLRREPAARTGLPTRV